MNCHNQTIAQEKNVEKKILLIGNPNVGKSVIFSRLTNIDVTSANYIGTTVTYYKGYVRFQGKKAELIDVPGIYTLEAISKAEEVAVSMLEEGADLLVCVIDSTHFERNLRLALELKKYNIPIVYVLNMSDVAKRKGIVIDVEKLSSLLGANVYQTTATKREGIIYLKEKLFEEHSNKSVTDPIVYSTKEIADQVVSKQEVKVTKLEKFGDVSMHPIWGVFIALFILGVSLGIIVGGGKALRSFILLPVLEGYVIPWIVNFFSGFVPEGLFLRLLVGEYGVLVKAIEWPFALILPYVLLFYIVFSFLEDSGYLPRLAVVMDGAFRKLGLPGSNIIPFFLGFGCAVPAILATRTASTKKERIIVVSMICIAIPCTAQTAAFINLLGDQSIFAVLFVFMMSFMMIVLTGVVLKRVIKGKPNVLVMEIPNFLLPSVATMAKKVWIRLKHFLIEAEIPMMIGILIAALVVETGAMVQIGIWMQPLVVNWLGLPEEASLALILGIIRRELTVMPLLQMGLTTVQLITGAVVALFYLPCISTLGVLIKEFKLKTALLITLSTFVIAFIMGGLVNMFLSLFM